MRKIKSKKSTPRTGSTVYREESNTRTGLRMTVVRDAFADTINRVVYRGERILLERRGKIVAAIVPAEDVELLEKLEDQMDLEAARKALRDVEKHSSIPWEQVRAEMRRRRG